MKKNVREKGGGREREKETRRNIMRNKRESMREREKEKERESVRMCVGKESVRAKDRDEERARKTERERETEVERDCRSALQISNEGLFGRDQKNFLDFRIFSLGHGWFRSHDPMDLALDGRIEGDPLSMHNWALGKAYKQNSLGLCRSIKFIHLRDHPCLSPSSQFPWSSCCEIVRVQQEKLWKSKNLCWSWPRSPLFDVCNTEKEMVRKREVGKLTNVS